MHLADGIVTDAQLVAGMSLIAAGSIAVALRKSLPADARGAAFTGTLAAFVMAAQAINVPLVAGASAHVIGATLLTLSLGAARAIVALAAVVVLQALLLADGGLVVLGVNTLHIAVLPVLAVVAVRQLLGDGPRSRLVASVAGTVLGNVLAATSLATLLVVGAGAPAGWTFSLLIGVQAVAGLIEGALTAVVVRRLDRTTSVFTASPTAGAGAVARTGWSLGWAAIALGVLVALAPLGSTRPDALERVVEVLVDGAP